MSFDKKSILVRTFFTVIKAALPGRSRRRTGRLCLTRAGRPPRRVNRSPDHQKAPAPPRSRQCRGSCIDDTRTTRAVCLLTGDAAPRPGRGAAAEPGASGGRSEMRRQRSCGWTRLHRSGSPRYAPQGSHRTRPRRKRPCPRSPGSVVAAGARPAAGYACATG
jgi:hypothetical protein